MTKTVARKITLGDLPMQPRFDYGEMAQVAEATGAGKYRTAVLPHGTRAVLAPFAKELEALGEPYEWVEGQALRGKLGRLHFTVVVYTPGCVLTNPAALCRGLADSWPENVTVFENSPVPVSSFQNGVHLTTTAVLARAPKTTMAANGFAAQFGFHARRFLHLTAHAA